MDGKAVEQAVAALKARLRVEITAAVQEFRVATGGLSPGAISVHMVDATSYGDKVRRYMVGDVTVTLGPL